MLTQPKPPSICLLVLPPEIRGDIRSVVLGYIPSKLFYYVKDAYISNPKDGRQGSTNNVRHVPRRRPSATPPQARQNRLKHSAKDFLGKSRVFDAPEPKLIPLLPGESPPIRGRPRFNRMTEEERTN